MQNIIKLTVKTLSNLFIGGAPVAFEIGGIDQYTVTNHEGAPYIPASSFKGALRNIVRELQQEEMAKRITDLYKRYIQKEKTEKWGQIHMILSGESDGKKKIETIKDLYKKNPTIESLFGIDGFNNTPRLLFSDLCLCKEFGDATRWFSIDAKTAIAVDASQNRVDSNPRIYKAVRNGLVFEGEIHLYKMELLGEEAVDLCRNYIIAALMKFNDGVYRLGNSKSRGYGKVEIDIITESREEGI